MTHKRNVAVVKSGSSRRVFSESCPAHGGCAESCVAGFGPASERFRVPRLVDNLHRKHFDHLAVMGVNAGNEARRHV